MTVPAPSSIYLAVWLAWAALAVAVVPYLLFRPAPYGRHGRPGWGPVVNARVAWLLMEAPSPLGMIALFLLGHRAADPVAAVFLGLWLVHYAYRAFVFPFLLPRGARPMPVAVLAAGGFFNLVNAYLNGYWLFFLAPAQSPTWLASPAFLSGGLLFLAGLLVHVFADRHLRRLRAASPDGYAVPRGPWFRLLSCPNYFGEIVEWSGFALATWSPSGLLFALWTAANLVPRAIHHHRWYRKQFPAYPASRRAVIPFLL
jgi:3-oxo-5-alpha-steroid 4-dehydrogenase 1